MDGTAHISFLPASVLPAGAYSEHPVSPLVLSDRLISLAEDAERAGFMESARHLIQLAHAVFDEMPVHP